MNLSDSVREMGDRLRQEFQCLLGGLAHELIHDGLSATDFQDWCSLEQAIHEVLQINAEFDALEQSLTSGFLPIELVAQNHPLVERRGSEQNSERIGQKAVEQTNPAFRELNHFPFMMLPTRHRFCATDSNPHLDNQSALLAQETSEYRVREMTAQRTGNHQTNGSQSPEQQQRQSSLNALILPQMSVEPSVTSQQGEKIPQWQDSPVPVLTSGADDDLGSDPLEQQVIARLPDATSTASHYQEHPGVELHPLHSPQSVEMASSQGQPVRSRLPLRSSQSQRLPDGGNTADMQFCHTERESSLDLTSLPPPSPRVIRGLSAMAEVLETHHSHLFVEQMSGDAPLHLSKEYLSDESVHPYSSPLPTSDTLISSSDSAKQKIIARFPDATSTASHYQEHPGVDLHTPHQPLMTSYVQNPLNLAPVSLKFGKNRHLSLSGGCGQN